MCVNKLCHVFPKQIDDSDLKINILRKRYWFPKRGNVIKKESLTSRANSNFVPTEELSRKNDLRLHALKIQSRNQGVAGAEVRATLHDPNSVYW